VSIADPIGAPRRLRVDLLRDLGKHRMEIHPNRPVEPLDADLRENRALPENRQIGTAFTSVDLLSKHGLYDASARSGVCGLGIRCPGRPTTAWKVGF
jgi:hypothetical protein